MWITVLGLLVLPGSLMVQVRGVLGIMIYPGDHYRLVQEDRRVLQDAEDQEGSFSEFIKRGNKKFNGQRLEFGLKTRNPSGEDFKGHILEQKNQGGFVDPRRGQQKVNDSEFYPRQNEGEWKAIRNSGNGEENQNQLDQAQLLLQQMELHNGEIEVAKAQQQFRQLNLDQTQHNFGIGYRGNGKHEESIDDVNEHQQPDEKENHSNQAESDRLTKSGENLGLYYRDHIIPHDANGFEELSDVAKETNSFITGEQNYKSLKSEQENPESSKDEKETSDEKENFPFKKTVLKSKLNQMELRKPYYSNKEKKPLYAVQEHSLRSPIMYKRVTFKPNTDYMPKPRHFLIEKKFPFHYEKHVPYSYSMITYLNKPAHFQQPVVKPMAYNTLMDTKVPYSLPFSLGSTYLYVPTHNLAQFEHPSHFMIEQPSSPSVFRHNQQFQQQLQHQRNAANRQIHQSEYQHFKLMGPETQKYYNTEQWAARNPNIEVTVPRGQAIFNHFQ